MLTGQMTGMDASNVLYGFACAGVHDCELLSGLTARLRRLAAHLPDNIQARDFEAPFPWPRVWARGHALQRFTQKKKRSLMQAFCMVLWSLAELRHAAPACFDALADAGTAALSDPASRKRFTSHELAVCLWVSSYSACSCLQHAVLVAMQRHPGVPMHSRGQEQTMRHICRRMGG